jgi:hypothetical protein
MMRAQRGEIRRKPRDTITPTSVRIDNDLRNMLRQAALMNDRTFTAELERRLWQSFQAEERDAKGRKGAR